MVEFKGLVLMLLVTVINAFAQYLLKSGLNHLDMANLFTFIPVIAGLATYALSALLLIIALKSGELNVLYPMISLTFVWVSVASVLFLDEIITLANALGICSILAGVAFITRGAQDG